LRKESSARFWSGSFGGEKKFAFEPVELRLGIAGPGLLGLGEPFAHG
jgi:hypothetical protein